MSKYLPSLLIISVMLLTSSAQAHPSKVKVVAADDIKWGYLNPLRGELSPGAADLWGDRTSDTATGMLVRFKKGFESPAHIHNITYRGIVIDGLMHNDDPSAEKMWLPAGSFWTQPAGENHTTAANGTSNLIYLEIDSGPYLVKPSKEHFDNGERPLNLHKNNMVWLDDTRLTNISADGVQASYLWQSETGVSGSMIKLPQGFNGEIVTNASEFRLVVIAGVADYKSDDKAKAISLSAGSYLESNGRFNHQLSNKSNSDVKLYIRSNTQYTVK